MQQSTATPAGIGDPVDDLGDAVIGLLHTWRCVSRRHATDPRSGAAALDVARMLGDGERRLSELAELRGVDQSRISRQVYELEAQQLVVRRPDPADRRASLVRLTPEGNELVARARTLRQDWLRSALARVPELDARLAARLLTAISLELDAHGAELLNAGRPHP